MARLKSEAEKPDQWAIVELMGHQRIAGRITEQVLGGASMLRVDVPEVDGRQSFNKLYGPSAIYAVSFVDEEIARTAARNFRAEPVDPYTVMDLRRQLEYRAERTGEAEDFNDDPDDDIPI